MYDTFICMWFVFLMVNLVVKYTIPMDAMG